MDPQSFKDEAVLSTSQCMQADHLAAKLGVTGLKLMERAGAAVADAVRARFAPCRVAVLCGPGNNGGDGFVAARHLVQAGYDVRLYLLGDVGALKNDAARAAQLFTGKILPLSPESIADADLVIDALFGAGLNRPLDGVAAALAGRLKSLATPVVAVDVPSGVNGDGEETGASFEAQVTVTFFRRKPAHLILPARARCGEIVLADIGLPSAVLDDLAVTCARNHPTLWQAQLRPPQTADHKYKRGHALVVGGGLGDSPGASRLAAMATLLAGAGLVTLVAPDDSHAQNAKTLTSVITCKLDADKDLEALLKDPRINAVLVGPGGGVHVRTRNSVLMALKAQAGVVLDADALSVFAEAPDRLFTVVKDREVVLTPHEGEFARLFPDLGPDFGTHGHDKITRVRKAAARAGAVILLKGADTVIATPDGHALINDNAPASLATAGAGDVLAGIILSFLAQGLPAFEAAAAGAFVHGQAARHMGRGFIAEELSPALPLVLQGLYTGQF